MAKNDNTKQGERTPNVPEFVFEFLEDYRVKKSLKTTEDALIGILISLDTDD